MACNVSNSTEEQNVPEENDNASMNILFIGNSITFLNDMPTILKNMAAASGKNVYVSQWVKGAVMLSYFSQSPYAPDIIFSKKWDYIILQDGDYDIIFPYEHQRLAGYVNQLKNLILINNPDTKILFHMLYALKDGWTSDYIHYDYPILTQKIIEGTTAFAKLVDVKIAPVGIAWNDIVINHPEIWLYHWDLNHPTYSGSYLMACVYYSTIFGESSLGNSYRGNLFEDDARIIQNTASETVLNF